MASSGRRRCHRHAGPACPSRAGGKQPLAAAVARAGQTKPSLLAAQGRERAFAHCRQSGHVQDNSRARRTLPSAQDSSGRRLGPSVHVSGKHSPLDRARLYGFKSRRRLTAASGRLRFRRLARMRHCLSGPVVTRLAVIGPPRQPSTRKPARYRRGHRAQRENL